MFCEGIMGNKILCILNLVFVVQYSVGKLYGDLFVSLLYDKGVLVLGLYWVLGILGVLVGYVFINFFKYCFVLEGDQVYIIVQFY